MIGLLFQRCTITKRVQTDSVQGTPIFSDQEIASNVSCRLDTMASALSRSRDVASPGSFSEETRGIIYLYKDIIGLDDTCIIQIAGDPRKYQVVYKHHPASYGSFQHLELEVRAITHR